MYAGPTAWSLAGPARAWRKYGMWNNSRPGGVTRPKNSWTSGRATLKACWPRPWLPSKRRPRADPPRRRRPRHHPSAPWHPEEHTTMPCRPQPEAEEEPPRRDTAQRLRTIERWLHHAEDELLYAPDAAEEAAVTPLDARYYLRWGVGSLGVLAIERFPM